MLLRAPPCPVAGGTRSGGAGIGVEGLASLEAVALAVDGVGAEAGASQPSDACKMHT